MAGTDEMANGNDVNRSYTDAVTAQLGERVTNMGRRQTDLETEIRSGFKQVEASLTGIATEMRAAIAALSSSLAERSRTQWPVIWSAAGVCTAALIAAGTFVYGTLSTRQDRTDATIIGVVDKMVTQKEMEWRTARSAEDRQRTEGAINDIRQDLVPRAEHERVWQNYTNKDEDLQRQVNELKQSQGNVYGARDVILDLRERLDRVERRGQP